LHRKLVIPKDPDLSDNSKLFDALQNNTHIVAHYFDIRTQNYFSDVMSPAFGVTTFWYRQEFAKSRGMVHWHDLFWRSDREPHNLLSKAIEEGLSYSDCSARLADWAVTEFGLTASHPGGKDKNGQPNTKMWPPPEGTAPQACPDTYFSVAMISLTEGFSGGKNKRDITICPPTLCMKP
jgi:hypothetical protein